METLIIQTIPYLTLVFQVVLALNCLIAPPAIVYLLVMNGAESRASLKKTLRGNRLAQARRMLRAAK